MNKTTIDKLEDDQLIAYVQEGNKLAFDELYNRHWKKLFNFTFNIMHDASLTEDVLQEVFVKVWINREKSTIGNIKPYLFNACRNNAISKIRKAKWTSVHEEVLETLSLKPDIELKLNADDLKQEIDKATETLPKRCREIFYMSRFEHLSIQEISENLNISHRTVENQLSIALKHIRPYISNTLLLALLISNT